MSDDLIERLERVEGGAEGTRWYRNPDGPEAVEEIEILRVRAEKAESEVERLREAIEPFVAVAKDRAVDAAEWRGKDSIHAIIKIDDLRRILSALTPAPVSVEEAARVAKAVLNAQTKYGGWGNLDEPQRQSCIWSTASAPPCAKTRENDG